MSFSTIQIENGINKKTCIQLLNSDSIAIKIISYEKQKDFETRFFLPGKEKNISIRRSF